MASVLRTLLAIAAVLVGFGWALLNVFGLAFCESFNCDQGRINRTVLLMLLMLIAALGFAWTLVSNRPQLARNATIWFVAAVVFGVGIPWLESALKLRF